MRAARRSRPPRRGSPLTASPDEARRAIISGKAGVGIVIPPDYHDRRGHGQPAKILVLIDGSDSTVSAGALASINGIVAADNLEILTHDARGGMPLSAQPIILFNPEGRTANYIIPGLVAILMQMIAIFLASGSVVREREKGTMEQLMVTPVDPLGLMLGKLAPYLVLGLGETALILAIMRWAFAHGFVRVHRSALVNLARVRELRRPAQREWCVVLDDGTELPVSRRLRPDIQRQLGRPGDRS